MERYSEYKDSGEKWLGEIPSHWEVKRWHVLMNENTERNTNCSITKQLQFKYGSIIEKNNQDEDREVLETISKYLVARPGDIMLNGLNLNYDFISQRVGQVTQNGVITSAYICLRPIGRANENYLVYLLKAMDSQKLFHGMGTGVRLTLSFKELKNVKLVLPPLSEQSAIVAYLDRITSQLDEAIAQQQRMIDLLNERKQIIIQHAVTKGLDSKAEMVESGVEWIGKMPRGWKCLPLKRCCSLIRAKASSNQSNRISLENIVSWTGSFIETDSVYEGNGILYKKGDILFGKLRPYLAKVMLAENKGEALGDFWVLRPTDFVLPNYLKFVFLCYSLIKLIDSTTYGAKMPRADWNTNSKTLIPIPPIAEQQKICEHINQIIDSINSIIIKNEHCITLLRERKQIIINEVVTGKVKVS